MLEIFPVEETKAEALQVKYPIIDLEIHTKGLRKHWKIIRVRNIIEAYQGFEDMLKGFDREDLDTLWSLVEKNLNQQSLLKIWKRLYGKGLSIDNCSYGIDAEQKVASGRR
ncbi:hypothetical protein Tco_1300635 [Tanacetum coccineum]